MQRVRTLEEIELVGPDGRSLGRLARDTELFEEAPAEWVRVRLGDQVGFLPRRAIAVARPPAQEAPRARGPVDDGGIVEFLPAGTRFVGEPIRAHIDFHGSLRRIDDYARQADVGVHVTHSFRRRDATIHGNVVPPAKRSNHLVGHAIDMNLVVDGELLNSRRLRIASHGSLPPRALRFLELLRADPRLRWGGDFVRPDPVHIDDNLSRRDPQEWLRKLSRI